MIIKVLIADDEKNIRNGLAYAIEENFSNIKIVGKAKNGLEALEMTKKLQPDIIISDIEMPKLNGLEFITELNKLNSHLKIFIISAHQNFKYAQEAVELGVLKYFTKPLKLYNFFSDLELVIPDILEQKIKNNKSLLLEFINNPSTKILDSKFNFLKNINLYHLCKVKDKDIEKISRYLETKINKNYLTTLNEEELVFLLPIDKWSKINSELNNLIQPLLSDFPNLILSRSEEFKKVEDINIALKQCEKALEFSYISLENNIVTFEKIKNLNSNLEYSIDVRNNLKIIFESLDLKNLKEFLNQSSKLLFKSGNLAKLHSTLFITEVLATPEIRATQENSDNILTKYKELSNELTLEQLMDKLSIFIGNILVQYNSKPLNKTQILVNKIKLHLHSHYMEDDISLNSISELFEISPSYLSNIFKKELGYSFKEYVSYKRIEKAKAMLKFSNESISNIAISIGYPITTYFTTVFKKNVGHTPNEYRKLTKID